MEARVRVVCPIDEGASFTNVDDEYMTCDSCGRRYHKKKMLVHQRIVLE